MADNIFSAEYAVRSETTVDETVIPVVNESPEEALETKIEQEAKRYGTGKPKRSVIRAKISDD